MRVTRTKAHRSPARPARVPGPRDGLRAASSAPSQRRREPRRTLMSRCRRSCSPSLPITAGAVNRRVVHATRQPVAGEVEVDAVIVRERLIVQLVCAPISRAACCASLVRSGTARRSPPHRGELRTPDVACAAMSPGVDVVVQPGAPRRRCVERLIDASVPPAHHEVSGKRGGAADWRGDGPAT